MSARLVAMGRAHRLGVNVGAASIGRRMPRLGSWIVTVAALTLAHAALALGECAWAIDLANPSHADLSIEDLTENMAELSRTPLAELDRSDGLLGPGAVHQRVRLAAVGRKQ